MILDTLKQFKPYSISPGYHSDMILYGTESTDELILINMILLKLYKVLFIVTINMILFLFLSMSILFYFKSLIKIK